MAKMMCKRCRIRVALPGAEGHMLCQSCDIRDRIEEARAILARDWHGEIRVMENMLAEIDKTPSDGYWIEVKERIAT